MMPISTLWGLSSDSLVVLLVADVSRETITVVGVITVLVLIGLSAFFASSEIAIFSLGDHRIGALVEKGTRGAETLAAMKSNPRRLLVTILVGNNVANVAMASVATGLLGMYVTRGEAVLVATLGITALVLLFGETAPKAYAVEHNESWALRAARPLTAAGYLLLPLVIVFDWLTRGVNRLLGSEGNFETAYVSRAELQNMIQTGHREGVITDEEHRMLQRLLRFRNRIAKEAMVPRPDVIAVSATGDLSTAIERSLESGFTQLPVYEDSLDEVIGIVDVHDLLAARERGGETSLRALATEPYLVPETKSIDDLLGELQAERRRIAVVVSEFGTLAGIVTFEDIVEEIIGEVLTETETVPIQWLDDDVALVRGEVNVHAVNEALEIDLPETHEFESIAGFVFSRVGRVVDAGEEVINDDARLIVETTSHNRILEVRIELSNADTRPESPNQSG